MTGAQSRPYRASEGLKRGKRAAAQASPCRATLQRDFCLNRRPRSRNTSIGGRPTTQRTDFPVKSAELRRRPGHLDPGGVKGTSQKSIGSECDPKSTDLSMYAGPTSPRPPASPGLDQHGSMEYGTSTRRRGHHVYRQMINDTKATTAPATGPGGHTGATLNSSAADPNPTIDTSDKSLPGPANHQPKTSLHHNPLTEGCREPRRATTHPPTT